MYFSAFGDKNDRTKHLHREELHQQQRERENGAWDGSEESQSDQIGRNFAPLWQNLLSLWQYLEGILRIWQNYKLLL